MGVPKCGVARKTAFRMTGASGGANVDGDDHSWEQCVRNLKTQLEEARDRDPKPQPSPAPSSSTSDDPWNDRRREASYAVRAALKAYFRWQVDGDWDMTGPSFSGIGFSNGTWYQYGGRRFAPLAGEASRDQQILIGMRVVHGEVPDQDGCSASGW